MDSSKPAVFDVSCFCLITGASRGIGRSIAVNISQKLGEKSQMVITARKAQGLAETKRLIKCISPAMSVRVVVGELGNSTAMKTLNNSIFTDVDADEFQHAIVIHNAGTLGDVSKKICALDDAEELQQHHFENVTSAQVLTAKFLTVFKNLQDRQRTVVQMSSLAAVKPIPTCSMYCITKAARDMLFSVLAKEEPTVRVLSYAPGPIDTDMFRKLVTETKDDDTRTAMKDLLETGKTVKLEDTIAKLLKILDVDNYISGAHIDYYD